MQFSLSYVPAGVALVAATIQFFLANASVDWPVRKRTSLNLAFLSAVAAGILTTTFLNDRASVRAEEERLATGKATQELQEKAHIERKEISGEIKELAALVGAMDPSLTDEQTLSRIGVEIHRLRERTSELDDELDGLRKYGSVARLNVVGLSGTAGVGLRESSPLSRALEGAYETTVEELRTMHQTKCDDEAMSSFADVATKYPHFPFAHWAVAVCLREAGSPLWRVHAERAMAILEHTTRISGRHSHHDSVRAQIAGWFRKTE